MDAEQWEAHYRENPSIGEPSHVLRDNVHLLPTSGVALDMACGTGANALMMAQAGLQVQAWDTSSEALAKLTENAAKLGLSIETQQRDVESKPPQEGQFDIIHVSRFLYRPIAASIRDALTPGGILFYQTFCKDKADPQRGPNDPNFLLDRAELLFLFGQLQPLAYREEGLCGDLALGLRNEAYLVAMRSNAR